MNSLEKFSYKTGQSSNKIKFKPKDFSGVQQIKKCALCKEVKQLGSRRWGLCEKCSGWCKRWIVKEYGDYYKQRIPKAMSAYFTPALCRGCKEETGIILGLKGTRIVLCDRCKEIYKLAYKDIENNRRSGRYRKRV